MDYVKLLNCALIGAIAAGDGEMIASILQQGADVNARDATGRTPLHHATQLDKSVDIISILLSNKAEVNAKDADGRTPLHTAVRNANTRAFQALINCGADVESKDIYGRTPKDIASYSALPAGVDQGLARAVEGATLHIDRHSASGYSANDKKQPHGR